MAEEKDGWNFDEGAEIAPGRSVLKTLGGGSRYEVLLVWDDRLFAHHRRQGAAPAMFVEDERALGELAARGRRRLDAARPPGARAWLRRRARRPTPARPDRAPRGADAAPPDPRAAAPLPLEQLAAAGRCTSRRALHYMSERGLGPPRREAGQHRHGRAAAADRPEHRARRSSAPRRTKRPLGTDAYMAPEQCEPVGHPGRDRARPPTAVGPRRDPPTTRSSGDKPFPEARSGKGDQRFPQLEQPPLELPDSVPPLCAS